MQFLRKIKLWFCQIFCKSGKKPQEAPPPPIPAPVIGKCPENWLGVAGVSVGDKHTKANPPVPCQDAARAYAGNKRRPCAFVADGAGSAALSHKGANEAVERLAHLAVTLDDINIQLLDSEEEPASEECRQHARRFIRHASESIRYLARQEQKPFKQFHCTLLMVIAGAHRILWVKVGDGHIVAETDRKALKVIGAAGKGEFANVTEFIKEDAQTTGFQCGVIAAKDISGMALMTDGAAEKLVSADGVKAAGAITQMLKGMREGKFQTEHMEKFLSNPDIWKPPGYTGDDKGLALLAQLDEAESR